MTDIERLYEEIMGLSALDRTRLLSRVNGKRTHFSHRSAVPRVEQHLREHGFITAPQAFAEGYLVKKLSSSEFEKCVLKHVEIKLLDTKVGRVKHYYTEECTAEHLAEKPPFRNITSGLINHVLSRIDLSAEAISIDRVFESDPKTYPCYSVKKNRPKIREALIPRLKVEGYRVVKGMTFAKEEVR